MLFLMLLTARIGELNFNGLMVLEFRRLNAINNSYRIIFWIGLWHMNEWDLS